jgi:hypothetical protein
LKALRYRSARGDSKKYPAAGPGEASAFLQSICLILQTSFAVRANFRAGR